MGLGAVEVAGAEDRKLPAKTRTRANEQRGTERERLDLLQLWEVRGSFKALSWSRRSTRRVAVLTCTTHLEEEVDEQATKQRMRRKQKKKLVKKNNEEPECQMLKLTTLSTLQGMEEDIVEYCVTLAVFFELGRWSGALFEPR